MNSKAWLFRLRALGLSLLLLHGAALALRAQATAPAPASATPAEDASQAELLKTLQQLREQFRASQLAMANSQLAADAKARAQTSALSEQLESIKTALTAEQERQQNEARRWQAERDRQELETQKANADRARLQIETDRSGQRMVYIASSFGCVGLLALILMPIFQWRAVNRMAEAEAQRALLPAPVSAGTLLPGGEAGNQAVALSNQRLMSVIDRIERRVLELEDTAIHPTQNRGGPSALASVVDISPPKNGGPARPVSGNSDRTEVRTALLAQGRALLAANKPAEALACYEEILRTEPAHPEALLRKGVSLERLQRDTEAIAAYNRAIEVDNKMALAYLHKGGICHRLARHDEALACYENALRAEEAAK